MSRFIPLIVFGATLNLMAQTSQPNPPTTPTQPDLPFSPRGLPASPVNPGLPASPVNPGLPGFTNWIGPWFTNVMGSNLLSSDVSALMVNLQNDMQQLLPVLAAINNNALLSSSNSMTLMSTNNAQPGSAATAATTRAPANGALLSQDLSTRVSQDLSTRVGGRAITTLPNTSAIPANISGINTSVLFGATVTSGGTNNFPLTSAQLDSLRALIVLQNDLERTLPIVAALNGGASPGLQTGLATNNFGTTRSILGTNNIFAPARSTPSGLTPTGR